MNVKSISDFIDNKNVWVAEYSQSQDAFNIQLLQKAIEANFVRALKRDPNDWVVIGYGSKLQVEEIISVAKKSMGLNK
jgi:hypothetical protein